MKNRRTWLTSNNETINISEMTNSHLFNTFKMLYRQGCTRRNQSYADIVDECYKRGLKPVSQLSKEDREKHFRLKPEWEEEQDTYNFIIHSNYLDFHS
jgi:hypothetical protein